MRIKIIIFRRYDIEKFELIKNIENITVPL